MSNTKASKVITVKSTAALVTAEQNAAFIADIKAHGTGAAASIKGATTYVMQQTSYKAQQDAIKGLAGAYKALKKAIGDKAIEDRAAVQWVRNQVKKLDDKYKWLRSESATAKTKAKQRAARQTKAAAPAKKVADKKAPETSIAQIRNALLEKELKLQSDFRGVIPAGKVADFDKAFAAFIQTIELILK